VNVPGVIATAVNAEGHREILGLDVVTRGGLECLPAGPGRARGLTGCSPVISDAHTGLTDAVASVLPGASWQRCRTHFMRNLLTRVPKSAQNVVATLVRTIFAQPDTASKEAQHARVVEELTKRFPAAAELLTDVASDLLAFAGFPKEHWRQIWSNNPQERLNREIPGAPTSSASSSTGQQSSAWSVPSSRNSTTSAPGPALHECRAPGQSPAEGYRRDRRTARGGGRRAQQSRVSQEVSDGARSSLHHLSGRDLSLPVFVERQRTDHDTAA
jgi:hypothetical protein